MQAVLPELGLSYEQRMEIYAAAKARASPPRPLFLSPPPHREAPQPTRGWKGELSLGHRRSLARTVAPERFGRLGAEKDVRVALELLRNPRLTEKRSCG